MAPRIIDDSHPQVHYLRKHLTPLVGMPTTKYSLGEKRMNLYIVRHCKATGQEREAPLSVEGIQQTEDLSRFLENLQIGRVVSSPFVRAVQSIAPFAKANSLKIEIEEDLSERILSDSNMENWMDCLKNTFDDMDLKFTGGESSREAMKRALNTVNRLIRDGVKNTLIVTHGNLMSLILKHYEEGFGFDSWKSLSNPDVYRICTISGEVRRLWGGEESFGQGTEWESRIYTLQRGLFHSWSIATSTVWTPDNPAKGQCGVTSLVINDVLGGEILKTPMAEGWHFYNRIFGKRYDFTSSQFNDPVLYVDQLSSREEAFQDTNKNQYSRLRQAIELQLKEGGNRI